MSNLRLHSLETAPQGSQSALQRVLKATGRVPNMLAVLANSPTALNAYLQLAQTLEHGRFDATERERIALAVSGVNGCEYCLAAHGWLARRAGLSEREMLQARSGAAQDPLAEVAAQVARQRGRLDQQSLDRARAAGLDDGALVELVAQVALMTLSNYLNNLAQPALDFPPWA